MATYDCDECDRLLNCREVVTSQDKFYTLSLKLLCKITQNILGDEEEGELLVEPQIVTLDAQSVTYLNIRGITIMNIGQGDLVVNGGSLAPNESISLEGWFDETKKRMVNLKVTVDATNTIARVAYLPLPS